MNIVRVAALESVVLNCFLGNGGISEDFLADYHRLSHSALEGSPGTHSAFPVCLHIWLQFL